MVRVGMSLALTPRASAPQHGAMAWAIPPGALGPQTPRGLTNTKKYYNIRVPNHAAGLPKTPAFMSGRSSSASPAFLGCSSGRGRRQVGLGVVAGALGSIVIERPFTAGDDEGWNNRTGKEPPSLTGGQYRVGQLRAKTALKAAIGTADDSARLRRLQQVVNGRAISDSDCHVLSAAQRQARHLSNRLSAGPPRPHSSLEQKRIEALAVERPCTAPAEVDWSPDADMCVGVSEDAPLAPEASETRAVDAEAGEETVAANDEDGGAADKEAVLRPDNEAAGAPDTTATVEDLTET